MRRLKHVTLVMAACSVLAAMPHASHAGTVDDLLQQATRHYELGEIKQSLRLLRRMPRSATPAQSARAQLLSGLNHTALGREGPARRAFTAALKRDATIDLDPAKFNPSAVALFRKARSVLTGTLTVKAPPGCTIRVDGSAKARPPGTLRLQVGTHTLRARSADGTLGATAQVVVWHEQEVDVSLELKPLPALLTLRTTPPGASATLGQTALGQTPLVRVSVGPGQHELVVQLDGRTEQRRRVRLAPGKELQLTLALPPQPAPPTSRPVAATLPAIKPTVPPPATPPAPQRAPHRRRIWTWITAGGAAAALATGIGLGLWARSDHEEFETTADPERYWALKDSVRNKALGANLCFGAAGALLVGAVVLYLFEGRPDRTPAAADRASLARPTMTRDLRLQWSF